MNKLLGISILTLSILSSAPFAFAHEKAGTKGKGVKCKCSEGAAHDCKGKKCEECAKESGEHEKEVKKESAPKVQ